MDPSSLETVIHVYVEHTARKGPVVRIPIPGVDLALVVIMQTQ